MTREEEIIMQEAFMVGRIYNAGGEFETPAEIQIKLIERCTKAVSLATQEGET